MGSRSVHPLRFARVLWFEMRGIGLSDRVAEEAVAAEEWMEDVGDGGGGLRAGDAARPRPRRADGPPVRGDPSRACRLARAAQRVRPTVAGRRLPRRDAGGGPGIRARRGSKSTGEPSDGDAAGTVARLAPWRPRLVRAGGALRSGPGDGTREDARHPRARRPPGRAARRRADPRRPEPGRHARPSRPRGCSSVTAPPTGP